MSEPAEDSGQQPQPGPAGGGEGQDKQPSKPDNSTGLPAYHFDPLTQSRRPTPAEHARPEDAEDATSKSDLPPTTRRPSATPGLDVLAEAAALVSAPREPESETEATTAESPTKTPNKGKQPATPGVDPGSVARVWSGLYRTPYDDESILIGVHETPGPITEAISRTNTPAAPGVEEHVGENRSFSLPPQLPPSLQRPSLLLPTSVVANQPQRATYSQSSGLAAGRLLALLNPGIVAGAAPSTVVGQASYDYRVIGGNNIAAAGPSRLLFRSTDTAAGGNNTAIPGPSGTSFETAGGNDTAIAEPSGTSSQAVGANNTAVPGPSDTAFHAAARGPSTPTRPSTPQAPTPSPLTPLTVSTVIITPKSRPQRLPAADLIRDNDPNGTLARRVQAYQTFKTASDFLERDIHPTNEALIAPPIHDTYVIKTVSTIKCDECSVKLANGGELYQCKTCSAQICCDCVNERLKQEADLKAFGIKIRQDRADAVGGFSVPVEPEDVEEMGEESFVPRDGRKKSSVSGTVRYQFEWQGRKKHMPFKHCYLDRRQFVGKDQGRFETDVVIKDYAGVPRRVTVRILQDTPRKGGGGDDGDGGAFGFSDKKAKIRKGRSMSEGADPYGGAKKKRKVGPKAKGKGKGKEKEPQGTEDEPIDLDEWDEDSVQAQVQSAVLGGRPAFEKLRRMQEAARLGRMMPPQPRPVMRGAGHGQGFSGLQQHGHAPGAASAAGSFTGFRPSTGDLTQQQEAELHRRYLARQQATQQQQQQWQQGYGRPFDQPQQGEGYGPTVHGHPNPVGFGNAAAHGQIAGGQGFPQQQYHAGPATPHGSYQPYAGYSTPGVAQTQPGFLRQNALYQHSPNTPAGDTANDYPTPGATIYEARRHVLGNEATTQILRPGWIAYVPFPAIYPNPHVHPGVHLGETRDIPFGRGNTFVEQPPLTDGTPLSLELPQPYFDNALAGLAEINHHNDMIARAIRASQRRDRRVQEGRDPDEPMTEAENQEEMAHQAREDARDATQRQELGLYYRWYDYQHEQLRRRGVDPDRIHDLIEAYEPGTHVRIPEGLRQQLRTANTPQPRGIRYLVNNRRDGARDQTAINAQTEVRGQQLNNSPASARDQSANTPQAAARGQQNDNPPAGVRVRPVNPSPVINSPAIQAGARGQPVNNSQAEVGGQQITGSRYNTVPPPANQARRGRPTQEPEIIDLVDSDEDTDTEVPRNVVRRARKRPRTNSATATSAQPARRLKLTTTQAQQPATSNTTTYNTTAQSPPVHSGPQPSRPSTEPRNVVRRARVTNQNFAAAAPTQAQQIARIAAAFPHTSTAPWPPVYRGPQPSHPSVEPRNVVRRARPRFEAPGLLYQAAHQYLTGLVADDSMDGLPIRGVNVGGIYPFPMDSRSFAERTAARTIAAPSLLPPVNLGAYASRIEMADEELNTRNRDTVIIDGFDSPVPPSSSPVREDGERLNVLVAAAEAVRDDDETESEGVGEAGEGEDVEMEEVVVPVKPGRLRSGKEFQ